MCHTQINQGNILAMAKNMVNLWQTSAERQSKYWLAISLGANPSWSRRLRDWPTSKIERFFGLAEATTSRRSIDPVNTLSHARPSTPVN